LLIFGACNLAALACFVFCFTLLPVLSFRPRKFVILWSVGSLLFLASFAAVMGPMNYVYHLLSGPRLPFTGAYFGSILLTLVFALKVSHCSLRSPFFTNSLLAPQHYPHPGRCLGPAGLPCLVFNQLLPHGLNRVAHCDDFWSQASGRVDIGLSHGTVYCSVMRVFAYPCGLLCL
jgi:uncharacterized MnhB-related membrane protein